MSFQMKITLWLRQGMSGEASGTKAESTGENEKARHFCRASHDFVGPNGLGRLFLDHGLFVGPCDNQLMLDAYGGDGIGADDDNPVPRSPLLIGVKNIIS